MNTPAPPPPPAPGEFPYRLSGTAAEPPHLTWLRNHSNYMAVRGLPDYCRIAAVLLRGILINNLVLLRVLLPFGIAVSLLYAGLLSDWHAQDAPEAQRLDAANRRVGERAIAVADVRRQPDYASRSPAALDRYRAAEDALAAAEAEVREARKAYLDVKWDRVPLSVFLTRSSSSADACWLGWIEHSWLGRSLSLTPPYLLTPVVAGLAALGVLLFPVLSLLLQIAGHRRSVASGSATSVPQRDRHERLFSAALAVVAVVALAETLPLLAYVYHRLRLAYAGLDHQGEEFLVAATFLLGLLSRAPDLLARLRGKARTFAVVAVALAGVLVPLAALVLVIDFLVFVPMSFQEHWSDVVALLVVAPLVYLAGFAAAAWIGRRHGAFRRGETVQLSGLALAVISGHLLLLGLFAAAYAGVFQLYRFYPAFVPDALLALPWERGRELADYGDLAFYFVFGLAAEIWLYCLLVVDVNATSAHGLYRDRLATAYLLDRRPDGRLDVAADLDLDELCQRGAGSTAPIHLINTALNLQGSRDIGLRDRRSDFFVFSPKFVGSERTGFCRSSTLEQVFPQLDLATAMAVSAAAASPNAGRETHPALVPLLTLLNVRLGLWVPHPGRVQAWLAVRHKLPGATPAAPDAAPGFTFAEVFSAELDDLAWRWRLLGPAAGSRRLAETRSPSTAHGLAGLAFSGGGIRSATLNLGIAQVLDRSGLFPHFDYLSTVSGGGYLGSALSAWLRARTPVAAEVGGTVSLAPSADGGTTVTVTPADGTPARTYPFPAGADLAVRDGQPIPAGTRLLRRAGSGCRSPLAGTVRLEPQPDGSRRVRVVPAAPGSPDFVRHATRFDRIVVADGAAVAAGDILFAEPRTDRFGDRFKWRIPPSLFRREMTMQLDETGRWVNLSDGGHLENLAAIELLRRRCRLLVIGDGEADPGLHFNGLATLLRTARIDLGIRIEIDLSALRLGPPGPDGTRASRAHFAAGRIHYPPSPGEPAGGTGMLLYLKSSYTGDEDEVIGEYRRRHPAFPHESTADQFFDEGQFEAYRSLGQHLAERTLDTLGFAAAPPHPEGDLARLLGCLERHRPPAPLPAA